MTKPRTRTQDKEATRDAAMWIDHDQAVIFGHGPNGQDAVETVSRSPMESEPTFELRTIREIVDRDRVVVSGPADVRLGFERAYVAMTHRPDRLVDVDPTTPTSRRVRRTA